MAPLSSDPMRDQLPWTQKVSSVFTGAGLVDRDPQEILPPEERRAAMTTFDRLEHKFALGGLILATVAGIAIPLYIVSQNRVDKHGKNSIAVAPDALLLMGAILLFCVAGFLGLYWRRRTVVVVSLFFVGFGFTLFVGLIGFAFILLGGWLMLRAWRVNKYGATNSKVVAREAAAARNNARRNGATRGSKSSARTSTKASVAAPERKAPTASKRYTPKSAPRKKIPKPTE